MEKKGLWLCSNVAIGTSTKTPSSPILSCSRCTWRLGQKSPRPLAVVSPPSDHWWVPWRWHPTARCRHLRQKVGVAQQRQPPPQASLAYSADIICQYVLYAFVCVCIFVNTSVLFALASEASLTPVTTANIFCNDDTSLTAESSNSLSMATFEVLDPWQDKWRGSAHHPGFVPPLSAWPPGSVIPFYTLRVSTLFIGIQRLSDMVTRLLGPAIVERGAEMFAIRFSPIKERWNHLKPFLVVMIIIQGRGSPDQLRCLHLSLKNKQLTTYTKPTRDYCQHLGPLQGQRNILVSCLSDSPCLWTTFVFGRYTKFFTHYTKHAVIKKRIKKISANKS